MLDNIRSALLSIWGNKLRSLLTLLGVVIGVSSVTTLVALGQGLKNDVSGLIQGFGTNVVVVVPGKIDTKSGSSAPTNPANFISGDVLTLSDVDTIKALPNVSAISPLSLVGGSLKRGTKVTSGDTIAGAFPDILKAMQVLKVDKGAMFTSREQKNVIVLSSTAAEQLFVSEDPVGKTVTVGKDELQVIGVVGKTSTSSLFSSSVDGISLVPFDEATHLNKDQVKIVRIVTKIAESANVKTARDTIHSKLLATHGEENFTVLTQDDILGLFDQFLNLATAMVSAIAAISLLVGGIGIMNIMLVTVTERTREIGLRKALGATQGAILGQFLTEAIVITFVGGLIGLGLSYATGKIVSLKTPLKPEFSLEVLLITVSLSVVIGVIFGLWPALRAARKDPIEALRYE